MANKPWTWIITFIKVIKYWKWNWEPIYNTLYKEKIKTCTFSFEKVVSNFKKKKLNKEAKKGKSKVAKKIFCLTFDGVRNNKDNIERKALILRKRERAIIIHQKCIINKRPVYKKLKACYYAFPNITLKGGAPLART